MPDNSPSPHPRVTLTSDELRLGFEVLEVFWPDIIGGEDKWRLSVCKVLGSSDIIDRVGSVDSASYVHRKFGTFVMHSLPPEWNPVGMSWQLDPSKAIFEAEIESDEVDMVDKIKPYPAKIRKPEQGGGADAVESV